MIKKTRSPFWHIHCNTRDCTNVFGIDTPGVSLPKRRVDEDTARLLTQFSWHVDGPKHYCPSCSGITPLYECGMHEDEAVYPMNVTYYVHHRDIANAYGWVHEIDGKERVECVQCQNESTPGWVSPVCYFRDVQHSWARIGNTLRCITPLCEKNMAVKSMHIGKRK